MASRSLTRRLLLIPLILPCLIMGVALPARAQAPAERVALDACVADARCKALADRGQAEYQAQHNEAALVSLREAYSLQPVPWLLFNIGRIHQKAERTDEALAAFRAFLQQSQAADEAGQREKARVYVEQVERERAAAERERTVRVTAHPKDDQPPRQKIPVYKKWWFWTAVDGAVAIVTIGTVLGIAAREPDLTNVMQYRPFTP